MDVSTLIRIANCCNAITTRHSYMRDGRGSHMIPLADLADIFMDIYPRETYIMESKGMNLRSTLDLILEHEILNGTWSFVLEQRHKIENMEFWSDLLDDSTYYHPRAFFFCVYPTRKVQQQRQQQQQQQQQQRQQQKQKQKQSPILRDTLQVDEWEHPLTEDEKMAILRQLQQDAQLLYGQFLDMTKQQKQQQQQQEEEEQEPPQQSSKFRRQLRLDEEANELYRELQPKHMLEHRHKNVKRLVTDMINSYWPHQNYQIGEFGSTFNGLLLESSDLDMTIVLPDFQQNSRFYMWERKRCRTDRGYNGVFNMDGLAAKLRQIGMYDVKVVNAKVPICKFYDPFNQIHADISVENTLAIENSKLIKEYTRVDHRVRPFMYIVKYFAKQRHINDSTDGTFSSYTYILLCLYFLMNLPKPVIPNLQQMKCQSPLCKEKVDRRIFIHNGNALPFNVFYHKCVNRLNQPPIYSTTWRSSNTSSISTLLIDFFQFYATVNKNLVILLNRPCKKNPSPKGISLTVVDPFIDSRNVAGTSTEMGWARIKREFKRATNMLSNGATFEQVFEEYQLVEYYDPHCIKNRNRNR